MLLKVLTFKVEWGVFEYVLVHLHIKVLTGSTVQLLTTTEAVSKENFSHFLNETYFYLTD